MAQISYDTFTITNIPDNLRQNFWVETTNYSSQIPAGVYITQNSASSFKNNPSGPNIFMQAANNNNGIRLRQGLLTLAEIMSDRFRLYTPNGSNQGLLGLSLDATDGLVLYKTNNAAVEKGLQLSSAGLEIFGSSQSTADVTVDSGGINIGKGKIIGGGVGSSYVPQNDFLYLSTQNYGSYLNVADSGLRRKWRLVIGNYFGVTEGGNAYLNGATISGKIIAMTGQIGGTSVGDSWGWTLGLGRLYSGTMGSDNSLHMRTLNLGTNDEAVSINNCAPRKDWRFTVGSKFGVTSTGELFADGANLTNINAGSINIGPVVKYYVCDTEAATPAKTIDNVPNFTLTIGMVINVTFTYGNTNSQPTLNINNTGAKSIMKPSSSGATNLSYYEYNFATSNTVRTFRYDGTYWVLQDDGVGNARSSAASAAYTAYDYITKINNAGIFISPYNQSPSTSSPGNSVKIDGTGMNVYKDGDSVAFYGTMSRIGKEETSHIEIDYHSLQLKDKEKDCYLYISDRRGEDGTAMLEAEFVGDGETRIFDVGVHIDTLISAIDSDDSSNIGSISPSVKRQVIFSKAPALDSQILISFTTVDQGAKAYTLGTRDTSYDILGASSVVLNRLNVAAGPDSCASGYETKAIGNNAHAEGYQTTASGSNSHAEGVGTIASGNHSSHAEGGSTKASGNYSHAEGVRTTASGHYSHAEGGGSTAGGDYSHAEGFQATASDAYSHAEGFQTIASAPYSHAGGRGSVALKSYQTVIGRYNKKDTEINADKQKAFIIGNGTADDNTYRSNALTVDWNGNVNIAGTIQSTSDNALFAHGSTTITPSAANTPTKKSITFSPAFKSTPNVVVTAQTTVPGTVVTGVGVSNISTTGCDIYVTRTNTTSTVVQWIAMCI